MKKLTIQRIYALTLNEFYLTRRSVEMLFDLIVFPMMNVILFGLITIFISGSGNSSGSYLILGVLLWEVITIVQYNVTLSSLWQVWSHNLTNLYIAPISIAEYLIAHSISAIIRAIIVVGMLSVGAYAAFGFNLLDVGFGNLVLFAINLSLFAFWIGIILLGLIFRFGLRIQAMAWGVIFLFQPLTASFFPVSVLPQAVQYIAMCLPPTYIFEAARQALLTQETNWQYIGLAFGLNICYFLLALFIFNYLFRRSKESGRFARNDLG